MTTISTAQRRFKSSRSSATAPDDVATVLRATKWQRAQRRARRSIMWKLCCCDLCCESFECCRAACWTASRFACGTALCCCGIAFTAYTGGLIARLAGWTSPKNA